MESSSLFAAPFTAVWEIASAGEGVFEGRLALPPGPLFAGHYPGAPVLPGSFLIEALRQAVEVWLAPADGLGWGLAELTACRFHAPLVPGDTIQARCELTAAGDDAWAVRATVGPALSSVALLRFVVALRRAGAPRPDTLEPPPVPSFTPDEVTALDLDAVRRVLPHRHPMLLVDRAVAHRRAGDTALFAWKAVTGTEPSYARLSAEGRVDWRYPDTLVIESFCQSCGLLRASSSGQRLLPDDHRVPVLARLSGFRFRDGARPGETLEHRVQILASTSEGAVFAGTTVVDGRVIARVDRIVAALAPASLRIG